MKYNFYRSTAGPSGLEPDGEPVATLVLDQNGEPTWTSLSKGFEVLCLPSFKNPMGYDEDGALQQFEPYSPAALKHLAEVVLPAKGFVLRKL